MMVMSKYLYYVSHYGSLLNRDVDAMLLIRYSLLLVVLFNTLTFDSSVEMRLAMAS